VDKVTIGLPANAFFVVVPLMAFLIYILKSGYFHKFKSSISGYAALPEYSSAYDPPSYGAPPLEAYGPPGYESAFRRLQARVNALEGWEDEIGDEYNNSVYQPVAAFKEDIEPQD